MLFRFHSSIPQILLRTRGRGRAYCIAVSTALLFHVSLSFTLLVLAPAAGTLLPPHPATLAAPLRSSCLTTQLLPPPHSTAPTALLHLLSPMRPSLPRAGPSSHLPPFLPSLSLPLFQACSRWIQALNSGGGAAGAGLVLLAQCHRCCWPCATGAAGQVPPVLRARCHRCCCPVPLVLLALSCALPPLLLALLSQALAG